MSDIVIGIDLGTTNSCASYYYDGILRILENANGGRTTPSIVYFQNEKTIVGEFAKKMGLIRPELGVFGIKRLIGRQKNDPNVEENLKYFPLKLNPDSEELTFIIEHKNTVTNTNPTEISAFILMEIKKDVEAKLGFAINKAVITVPAYFNVNQREATLEAAKKAGFQVLKLLNEPTAAALSYYHYKKMNKISYAKEHYSLVFDLGGGTFDVAIIRKCDEDIEVICVDGDSNLGGQDFDNKIFDFSCQEVKKLHNYVIQSDRRITRRLLGSCEEAKKELSTPKLEEVQFSLHSGDSKLSDIEIELTQKKFDEMIEPHIKKTILIVDNCLKTAKLSKDDISEIILAGGSTRVPKIQEMLSQYFNKKQLNKYVNPDECVAEGAALQAALLSKNAHQQLESIKISEVTPCSLGIANFCDKMTVIIPRNSKIPITKEYIFVNCYDQQTTISFKIYEGERLNSKKNRYLATLTIDNLTPAPPEQCEVTLNMSIDNNGIFTTTAQEKHKNNVKDLKTTYTKVANNEKSIKNEIQSNAKYEEEDRKFDEFVTWKNYLLDYCVNFCYEVKQNNLSSKYADLCEECEDTQIEILKLDVEDEKQIKDLTINILKKCEKVAGINRFKSMPEVPKQVVNEFLKKRLFKRYV